MMNPPISFPWLLKASFIVLLVLIGLVAADDDGDKYVQETAKTPPLPFVLVTGANGLVASNLVHELLQRGHHVRATVRNLLDPSKTSNLMSFPNAAELLEFAELDLSERDPHVYSNLLAGGVEWIFHVAAPFVDFKPQSDAARKIDDAVESMKLLLGAAANSDTSSVTQFVYTGSAAAIIAGYHDDPIKNRPDYVFTEEDWTNVTAPHVTDYAKMKTLTELAAWEFVEEQTAKGVQYFRFTSLLPVYIMGPFVSKNLTTSNRAIFDIMTGTYPGVFDIYFPIVDIRDVVDAHIRAANVTVLTEEGEKYSSGTKQRRRFLLTRKDGTDIFLPEVARILNEIFEPLGYTKISTWIIPKWLLWIMSLFDALVAEVYELVGVRELLSNAKSRQVLGMSYEYDDARQTILDTAYSMIEQGVLPKTEAYEKVHGGEKHCAMTSSLGTRNEDL